MTGHRLKFDPKAADEGLYFVADAGGETPDWGLQIVAFGLTRSVSPVDVAVPAVQSAIVNRQSAIGMMNFPPRIKGVFTGPTDGFDPARHYIDVGAVGTGGGKVDKKAV